MKKILLITILLNFKSFLKAEDSLGKIYNFSEDIRDVILKSPGGNPIPNRQFVLTTKEADQMKALSYMDDYTLTHLEVIKSQTDCDKNIAGINPRENDSLISRVDNRKFKIQAAIFTTNARFEQDALGRLTGDNYFLYMVTLNQAGSNKAWDIMSIASLEAKYKSEHPSSNYDSLSLSEREKLLSDYAASYLGQKLPDGLLMQGMAFQNLIDHPADWRNSLLLAKDKLSSEQKIELISKLGGYFSGRYNYARNAMGEAANGTFVDTEQLLQSLQDGTPGGICRDITLAQTQMLKELGFKQNYVLTYKNLQGTHSNVITVDPETGKIIKFNYDETSEMKKGSGVEALIQDTTMPDHGIVFRIYDSDGKPVTKVSSELGSMLKDSAGGDIQKDYYQRNYNLKKVEFSSPSVNGNFFTGKTSSGETLIGAALFKKEKVGKYLNIGAGVSISKLEGDLSLLHIDQENLYGLISAELESPKLKTKNAQTNLFIGGSGEGLMSNNKETNLLSGVATVANKEHDLTSEFHTGVETKTESSDNKTAVDTKIYASFYPDSNHIARLDRTTAVLDSVVVKSGISHTFNDDTKALVDTAIIMKNYGTSLVIRAALEDEKRKMRYVAGVSQPLTSDMPTFLPGGEHRAFTSITKQVKDYEFSIEFERNFDTGTDSLSGSAKVKY